MTQLAPARIAATAVAVSTALFGLSIGEHPRDLELRVGDAVVEPIPQPDVEEPGVQYYWLRIPLENVGTRPIALVGVRRVLFSTATADPISDSTMATALTVEPGDTLLLGEDQMTTALGALTGAHFLVLAIRYGDAEDYRSYEGRRIVFKWPGVRSGLVPVFVPMAPSTEAADILRRAFELGGWWGDTGPEQNLPLDWRPQCQPVGTRS